MHTSFFVALAAVTAVSAQNSSSVLFCGPGSNCEAYTGPGGVTAFRIKPGMGIGSADYIRRFGNPAARSRIMKRQTVTTKVSIGDTWVDWGCDSDPKKILEVLNTICKDEGTCDTGTPGTVSIEQLANGSVNKQKVELSVTASATYENADVKAALVEAILTTADPGVLQKEQRSGTIVRDSLTIACETTKFPNFLQVTRFIDGNVQSNMEVQIEVPSDEDTGLCAAVSGIVGAIAGLLPKIGDIATSFFGTVGGTCGAIDVLA